MQGSRYFSLFDFSAAYYQIPVDPKSRSYVAFITLDGLYHLTRMHFGAAGAGALAAQQRMVNKLLTEMKWICALAYLEDVIVLSHTLENYLVHLRQLFEKVKKIHSTLSHRNVNCVILKLDVRVSRYQKMASDLIQLRQKN